MIRFCSAATIDFHQPLVEIWSPVLNDDTNSPTVGNSHSATSKATEMWTTQVSVDFVPATLPILGPPHRISRRAVTTFQTRIGDTSTMMMMALADPTPQSLARNSLSNM